ncbi:YheC/YheD family protein [Tumebacillus flagellatus]|uniref:YheC/YheD family endospore coat-associated protein n=1 Tax=Tumebacillus flagellatus TaxID=1157490 RepID=UPI00126886B3|nr:YheC/YheD family protein [Tumebacillus flagellatus]
MLTTIVPARNTSRRFRSTFQPKAIWNHLARAAHEQGLAVCLFRPEDLSASSKKVLGMFSEDGATWKRKLGPLPDIVYDNVFVHLAGKRDVLRARRFFLERGTPLYNPRLGNKTQLAAWLRAYPSLWRHHPKTVPFTQEEQVFQMLAECESLYLKPISGSAGQGILEIRPADAARYCVRAAKFGNTKQPYEAELPASELKRLLQRERNRCKFILQEGVELLHIDDGKIDLRTPLQRNRQGKWEQVALIVKRGRQHSIVSNYHAGGSAHDWAWLQEWAQEHRISLPGEHEVEELSQRIACAYADKAPHLATLGLDLGIDTSGKLWLLDVNARPGRNILDADQKIRCFELHAEFAAYLLDKNKG